MKRSPLLSEPEVEHLQDVIAADAAGGLRLALEAPHGFFRNAVRVQHLDRDTPLDEGIFAFVDRAHPALANQAHDAVLALDDLSGLEHWNLNSEYIDGHAPRSISFRLLIRA